MIPFFRNLIRLDSEPRITSEIRQSTVTTSSDPITEDIEGAEAHLPVTAFLNPRNRMDIERALNHLLLLAFVYPVNRMDRFEIKRD